jgi:hypothetical protein
LNVPLIFTPQYILAVAVAVFVTVIANQRSRSSTRAAAEVSGARRNHTHRDGRGAVRTRVNVANKPVHIITAHLKSKLLEFPGNQFSTKDEDLRVRVAAAALARRSAELPPFAWTTAPRDPLAGSRRCRKIRKSAKANRRRTTPP